MVPLSVLIVRVLYYNGVLKRDANLENYPYGVVLTGLGTLEVCELHMILVAFNEGVFIN